MFNLLHDFKPLACHITSNNCIADDSFNNKKGRKGDEEDGITIPTLTEIIEESLRVYWEFLCTDKDENNMILKGPGLQDSVDSELLSEIRTDFQKVSFKRYFGAVLVHIPFNI